MPLRPYLPPVLFSAAERGWDWLRTDPDDQGSRLHVYAFDERKRDRLGASRKRVDVRAFAHFRIPRNPVCATLGCSWTPEHAYSLPEPLWGRLDLWKAYRADNDAQAVRSIKTDRAYDERRAERENPRRRALGQPLIVPRDGLSTWSICKRCRRREAVATHASGVIINKAVLAGKPQQRRVEASAEVSSGGREIGVTVKIGCGDGDDGLGLDVALPGVGKAYLRLEGVAPRLVEWLSPRLGETRVTEIRLYGGARSGPVYRQQIHVAHLIDGEQPRGSWRNLYVNLNRAVLGKRERREGKVESVALAIPMPEGIYQGTATLTEVDTWLARTPWRTSRHYALDVKIPEGIPVPGNTESDLYDGEDIDRGFSTSLEHPHSWQAKAIGLAVEGAFRDRLRYGRDLYWQPKSVREAIKDAQRVHGLTAAEKMGDVPITEAADGTMVVGEIHVDTIPVGEFRVYATPGPICGGPATGCEVGREVEGRADAMAVVSQWINHGSRCPAHPEGSTGGG